MEFDELSKRLSIKIVYYGPAMSGKTTNVLRLHDHISTERRGDLVTLDTTEDRTLFFDLLPFYMIAPSGLKIKVKIYTVPGQVRYDATRKAILSEADGIAFIANSQISEQFNNSENFNNLQSNCQMLGMDLSEIPLVVQYNKQDLKNIIDKEDIRKRWEQVQVKTYFTSALYDQGVVETFQDLIRFVYRYCDTKVNLSTSHGLNEDAFIDALEIIHD